MRRIWIAIKVFFVALFNGEVAKQVDEVLQKRGLPAPETRESLPRPPVPQKPAKPAPVRSDAITLLATLQREARFIDFLQEPLAGYADAQIGAVARDVHRDCGAVIQRLFALKPILEQEEGTTVEVPTGFDANRFRLTGNVTGEPPFHGQLMHHGWIASQCDVPAWTGSEDSARIVAPVEVELK
jgi:hypothetical protein